MGISPEQFADFEPPSSDRPPTRVTPRHHAIWCKSERAWWAHSDGSRILYDSAPEARSIMTGLQLLFPTKSYRLYEIPPPERPPTIAPPTTAFLEELRTRARIYGWTGDYGEITDFLRALYRDAGIEEIPNCEPYEPAPLPTCVSCGWTPPHDCWTGTADPCPCCGSEVRTP